MTEGTPVVLDTTVVSNFATTDSLDWLRQSLPNPIVPNAVRTEIQKGVDNGHSHLGGAVSFLESSVVTVRAVETTGNVESLDAGEAAALALATELDGVLATDDATARRIARSQGVPITGSIGLLVRGIVRDDLERETANDWLQQWKDERSYYAPVDRVEEALPDRTDDEN